ncbi:hypothetical protein, partial [Paraburkholderia sp. Ac-20347]|uniref:hypothetical protein n=1 Tax=Paraburkholderia sp. Ac-20347 TaxID=2703892 RepID=UPI00197EBA73
MLALFWAVPLALLFAPVGARRDPRDLRGLWTRCIRFVIGVMLVSALELGLGLCTPAFAAGAAAAAAAAPAAVPVLPALQS